MSRLRQSTETEPRALTVSELTGLIKDTLHEAFVGVWVAGEMCDISRPQSGHIYFTLKDAQAQIRAVMWRSTASQLRFEPDDGLEVICCGEVDVYPPRGSYQLIVRQLEPRGLGAMQLALRQLQQKLAAEGLFDPRHKKRLPRFPSRIGFVTSPTGAAVRDFLEVLRRRWQGLDVMIIPSRVQGDGAALEIVRGIQLANRLSPALDVLVVGRGGGSIDDLSCFNDERVVRAIFASQIPVVSAVGHEIDVTLADLVADVRALTPTEAAERIVPSVDELRGGLASMQQRLVGSLRARALQGRSRLSALAQHRVFRRPLERVRQSMERVDELGQRAARIIRARHGHAGDRLTQLAAHLESLSPLGVLARGYTLTTRVEDGKLVRDASSIVVGQQLKTRFARGSCVSRVEEMDTGDEQDL
jgi:exodeoxyribonuclease VII large subunit